MKWDESLATLNIGYRELIARVDKFLLACKELRGSQDIAMIIDFMSDYAVTHFYFEETLHEINAYPKAARHKELHDGLILRLRGIREQLVTSGATLDVLLGTCRMLTDWVTYHVNGDDWDFIEFQNKKNLQENS